MQRFFSTRTWVFMMVVSLLVTLVVAQQQPITYLDVGGIFPLLTTTGTVDPAGVQRQAGIIPSPCFSEHVP